MKINEWKEKKVASELYAKVTDSDLNDQHVSSIFELINKKNTKFCWQSGKLCNIVYQ